MSYQRLILLYGERRKVRRIFRRCIFMKHTCIVNAQRIIKMSFPQKRESRNKTKRLDSCLRRNDNWKYFQMGLYIFPLIVLVLLSGCEKPVKVAVTPSNIPSIPAKVAIAPVQITTATIEIPSAGQKTIIAKLISPMAKNIESFIKEKGVFLEVFSIDEDVLPLSPSIPDIVQAGREKGADLVLLVKVTEIMGKIESEGVFDFRPKFMVNLTMGLVVYETATGARLYHKKESIDLKGHKNITTWSEGKFENLYISVIVDEALPSALSTILPKLHEDMASYKPPAKEKTAAATAEFIVDVDRVPRTATEVKKNSFAVVVGIETYRDLPQAEFTVRDAKIMKEYLIRVMGFPEENIVSLLNERATKGDIEGYIGTWLKNNVGRDSSVFIYYGGHGAPNPVTGEAFIIPFDGNPAFPEATGIPLKRFYGMLAELQVKDTMVIMDSCFSGSGGRSVMAKGGRPMAISVENPVIANKNIVVMTAATGSEISSSYPEKRHGLFTYFFLKGLQGEADFNGDKTVSLGELYNYVTPQVKKIAKEKNMEQTPVMLPGIDLLGERAVLPLGRVSK
jgi:hypothetical protein